MCTFMSDFKRYARIRFNIIILGIKELGNKKAPINILRSTLLGGGGWMKPPSPPPWIRSCYIIWFHRQRANNLVLLVYSFRASIHTFVLPICPSCLEYDIYSRFCYFKGVINAWKRWTLFSVPYTLEVLWSIHVSCKHPNIVLM